jgi:pilus assembly protein CpaB
MNMKKNRTEEDGEEKEQNNMKFLRSRAVAACFCVLFAIGIAFVLIPHINAQTREVTTIVRLNAAIPENTLITTDMLTIVEVGSYGLPSGVLSDPSAITGKYAAVPLLPADNLTADKFKDDFAPADSALYALVEQDKLAVSVTVNNLASSVSGKLQAGDAVCLFSWMHNEEGQSEVISFPELACMEVIAVTNARGTNTVTADVIKESLSSTGLPDNIPATITLLATPQQAKRLIEIENGGKAHAALLGRGTAAKQLLKNFVIPAPVERIEDVWLSWELEQNANENVDMDSVELVTDDPVPEQEAA